MREKKYLTRALVQNGWLISVYRINQTNSIELCLESVEQNSIPNLGLVSSQAFTIGTNATTSADRLIYNTVSGDLFYDADGVGGID